MSLRRKRIPIPNQIKVNLTDNEILIEGKEGKSKLIIPNLVSLKIEDNLILVDPTDKNSKKSKSLAGFVCKEILNKFVGVEKQVEYRMTLVGVGYKAQVKGNSLELSLGYSHAHVLSIPINITVSIEKNTEVVIKGIEKSEVGLFAAKMRQLRMPEPYKGKGVLYKGEKIILKPGKSGK